MFNVDKKSAYDVLKSGADGLIGKSFSYYENNKLSKSNWVDTVAYVENGGFIEVIFTTKVVAFISELERRFTAYDINQVANLKNKYALRLYESLIQFKSVGKLNISLIELRERLGIESDSYSQMAMFKVRVLDLAVSQINEHTDITVKYEQVKQGRTITSFKFSFKQKAKATAQQIKRDDTTGDLFSIDGLSDAQLARIARNKQFIADYNHLISPQSNTNNMNDWVNVMVAKMKTDIKLFNKKPLNDYLK